MHSRPNCRCAWKCPCAEWVRRPAARSPWPADRSPMFRTAAASLCRPSTVRWAIRFWSWVVWLWFKLKIHLKEFIFFNPLCVFLNLRCTCTMTSFLTGSIKSEPCALHSSRVPYRSRDTWLMDKWFTIADRPSWSTRWFIWTPSRHHVTLGSGWPIMDELLDIGLLYIYICAQAYRYTWCHLTGQKHFVALAKRSGYVRDLFALGVEYARFVGRHWNKCKLTFAHFDLKPTPFRAIKHKHPKWVSFSTYRPATSLHAHSAWPNWRNPRDTDTLRHPTYARPGFANVRPSDDRRRRQSTAEVPVRWPAPHGWHAWTSWRSANPG